MPNSFSELLLLKIKGPEVQTDDNAIMKSFEHVSLPGKRYRLASIRESEPVRLHHLQLTSNGCAEAPAKTGKVTSIIVPGRCQFGSAKLKVLSN